VTIVEMLNCSKNRIKSSVFFEHWISHDSFTRSGFCIFECYRVMMTLSTTILKLRAMDTDLFIISTREPVHPLRHRDIEPGSFAQYPVFDDRDAGDRKNFREKKSPGPVPA